MNSPIKQVVIVGGGTAGWLAACVVASKRPDLAVTLVEAPNIPTIGVGEGTWPTMRQTLADIGIAEAEFLRDCDASFKQGSRFDGWVDGSAGDSYLHPFTPLPPGDPRELIAAWSEQAAADLGHQGMSAFCEAMTAQHAVCASHLAPRQRAMPDYAGALNYGYHLDAGRFAVLLSRHATQRLGVTHVAAEVLGVIGNDADDIVALHLAGHDRVTGDLFLDCSGQAALLINGHFAVPWVDRSDVSFNDRALAVQVPVAAGSAIASQTIGTAHEAGWIWDIGLPSRRGIGCVYSSRFLDDERARAILSDYVARHVPGAQPEALTPRQLCFATGHRERFWVGNCLAIGQSAGFIEPLEASAIVMVELSLKALTENFPINRAAMDIHARRFNAMFRYRWDRIVEFLKLHYALSRRLEPYWLAQRSAAVIPEALAENLMLWQGQPPSAWDFPRVDEVFPATSYHYVLYGMGFPVPRGGAALATAALGKIAEVRERARALTAALPSNRDYLNAIAETPPLSVAERETVTR